MTCPVDFLATGNHSRTTEGKDGKTEFNTMGQVQQRESVDDGRRQLVERNTVPRLKTRQGWQYKTMQINAQYRNIMRAEPKGMIAPWTRTRVRGGQGASGRKKR